MARFWVLLISIVFITLVAVGQFQTTTHDEFPSGRLTEAPGIAEVWRTQYGSGLWSKASDDSPLGIGHDRNGNVFICGSTSAGSPSETKFLIVKYDASGVEQWSVTEASLGTGKNVLNRIAVDADGSAYVTGVMNPGSSGNDYATIKYDSNGVRQWIARYNGFANGDDASYGIALDGSGNVYVTGYSFSFGSGYDYVTIKYDPSGVERWISSYNGPGNGYDAAFAIGVDDSRNVFVTGYSDGPGSGADYATVKYDSNGVQQWVARYNGPTNGFDRAYRLALSNTGSIYVTGTSEDTATYFDFATIKYDSNGNEQWVRRYTSPGHRVDEAYDLKVDKNNDVCVTGLSDGEYATLRYDADGFELWIARKAAGTAIRLATDNEGNTYVTGTSNPPGFMTVKYNRNGVEEWARMYVAGGAGGGLRVDVDPFGNILVTGNGYTAGAQNDCVTIQYDSSGTERWVARFDGSAQGQNFDILSQFEIDHSQNIILTGMSRTGATRGDFATVKIDANGIQRWVARYNGSANGEDSAVAIAVDALGSVYVTGASRGASTNLDYATIKYDSDGVEQWVARYDDPGHGLDVPSAIDVDVHGNVLVTGHAQGSTYTTIKYDRNGVERWVARYQTSRNAGNPVALRVGASGNVYVTGRSDGAATFLDFATICYDSAGSELWVRPYNGDQNGMDGATSLAIDSSENVYVTGFSEASLGTPFSMYKQATVKYSAAGTQEWIVYHDSLPDPGNSFEGEVIAIGHSGEAYISGDGIRAGRGGIEMMKYDADGRRKWLSKYRDPGEGSNHVAGMDLDQVGNVYVIATRDGSMSGDFLTVKFDPNGIRQWLVDFSGSGNSSDSPVGVRTDASGNIIVAGTSSFSTSGKITDAVYSIIKYADVPKLDFSARSFLFQNVEVSCRTEKLLVVRNSGSQDLIISDAISDDPNFTIFPRNATILPSDSVRFVITFSPKAPGVKSAHIVFLHNGITLRDTLNASGTGEGDGTQVLVESGVGAGWQLISLPVNVTCPYVLKGAFAYDRIYQLSDVIQPGLGYWKKFTDSNYTFVGYAILSPETVTVRARWNMIGSTTTNIPTNALVTIPEGIISSSVYQFDDAGYRVADTIRPGHGYWVNVRQDGKLLLVQGAHQEAKITASISLASFNQFKFLDASGKSSILYFADTVLDAYSPEEFALPPIPPEGVFDARFATNRAMEVLGHSRTDRFPIVLSSAHYPLKISWSLGSGAQSAMLSLGNRLIPLKSDGTVTLTEDPSSLALVRATSQNLPLKYSLAQNYPNPFNPSTVIRYSLPLRSKVRLSIINILGQEIATVLEEEQDAGLKSVVWNAIGMPTGVYFYRLQAGSFSDTKKLILMK